MLKEPRRTSSDSDSTTSLILLFGAMYFVQGIAEPTEGLIAQPVRSLLKEWGYASSAIGTFAAILALPWSFKPLYGLLTDFVPIAGTRRRGYLILTSAATVAGLITLYLVPLPPGSFGLLLALLLVPTISVAFSDVVVDALMIEKGQPTGRTGLLQSVQWAAMYGGSILAGLLGGWLSQHGHQRESFLICAVTGGLILFLAIVLVRETPNRDVARQSFRSAAKELMAAARTPSVIGAASFLFLWNFNPFSTSVLYMHLTDELGISEQTYGYFVSLLSVGAIVGSLAYGQYCRRVPLARLIHLSIVAGVISTLAYCFVTGPVSAAIVSVAVGITYMTGSMVQLDLAARACPLHAAGTTFALLMALTNLSMSLSTAVGGWLYEEWSIVFGADSAFQWLVVVGALTTSACWLLLPLLRRAGAELAMDAPHSAD